MAVTEYFQLDIRMAQSEHPVDIDQQRHYGYHDAGTYLRTVQPIEILAINANVDNGEKHHDPKGCPNPVDAVKRHLLHRTVRTGQHKDAYPYHRQQPHHKPVHVLPVRPVGKMDGYQPRQLDAFEHNDINHRIKHREIARRRHAETHIRETLERAPHPEEARHKTHRNLQGERRRMQRDEVARHQDGAYRQQDMARHEPALQADKNREDDGHADKRGIPRHRDMLLDASQLARHLIRDRQKHASVELESHGKEHRQENAYGRRQEFLEIADARTPLEQPLLEYSHNHTITSLPAQ